MHGAKCTVVASVLVLAGPAPAGAQERSPLIEYLPKAAWAFAVSGVGTEVRGELDARTFAHEAGHLQGARAARAPHIVLDLS